jgi:uncharacterized protein (DUF4415 family)
LANRLAKGTIGISELDKEIENVKLGNDSSEKKTEAHNKLQKRLNEILREYF